jgi:hypothetical protein
MIRPALAKTENGHRTQEGLRATKSTDDTDAVRLRHVMMVPQCPQAGDFGHGGTLWHKLREQ